MFKRKSIVLSGTDDSEKKAVMSLQENEYGISGTLRLYNFPRELSGISSLGLYVEQKVYKAGLTFKSGMLYEFFVALNKIPYKFSCAVVNFQNAEAKPILYGSSEGSEDEIYADIINEISKNNTMANTQAVLDEHEVDFDRQEKEEVEKEIDKALCEKECESCANCIYKQYFYQQQAQSLSTEKEEKPVEEKPVEIPKEETEEEVIFFDKLKPQIDRLFASNPVEKNLQNLIPSSKWVKVEYEDDGDFYVFGLLYDDNENVQYVCYGVPAVFEEQPPKELSGYPIWLPLDRENRKGFGYWLTYQDASTGEPVKAIVD